VAGLATRTAARNDDWGSASRLWSASAQATPDSIKVIRGLAAAALDGEPSTRGADEALAIAARGLQILDRAPLPLYHRPAAFYEDVGRFHLLRAEGLAAAGDSAGARDEAGQAVAMLQRAEAVDQEINRQVRTRLLNRGVPPGDVRDLITATIYRNLGAAYLAAGEPPRAFEVLSYLERTQPDNSDAHYAVGVALGALAAAARAAGNDLEARSRLDAAAVALIEAILLDAASEPTWNTLGQVYALTAPTPAAVLARDGKWTLNMEHPSVAIHFAQACQRLVGQLQEAGLTLEADRWKQRAIKEFRLSPGLFERRPGASPDHDPAPPIGR
jgi:tetratricopeptide (TPR) repeat protein